MIEHILTITFVYLLGAMSGKAYRDWRLARKTVEGIEWLLKSPHYGTPSRLAALHVDQDAVEIGPLILTQTLQNRLYHHSVRGRHA
jgi:hypothetical protein